MQRLHSGVNFARYTLGEITLVALRDGYVDMPPTRLRQDGNRPFGADLPEELALIDGRLRLCVNAFLVIEQGRHILIDTGAADAWEPSMGLLLDALAEAGIPREAIGTVAFTHTHSDHINGLVAANGSDAFPNLERLLVPQQEIAAFDRSERLARYRELRMPFAGGTRISDGITAVHAPGHEVGHTAFEVVNGGETLLIWGDIVHVPSVQFLRPGLTWEFDRDQAQARDTRAAMLARAARPDVFVAGAHLDFPGVGSVGREKDGYRFSPI
jgi:glyoxylase-like metal-dependent hydrolase (beta-lactamase superfamily II)